ncbi:hypothetical protein B0A50_02169 [Salinomyces thailandicus]|uniref:Carboxymuconolactone decarboxylase-like domain-containing protein n=1 Tax=Salinomyces thailandicus TaxID=706561 RepID=A0A4U0U8B0_9PEZI|nr:hypothetical protein B0A50_02169 [Salinomyces thailandica]
MPDYDNDNIGLNAHQRKLKANLLATGEPWTQTWQHILLLTPAYLAAYTRLRAVPVEKQHLPRKVQELLLLAMDASCTHLYVAGIRVHTAGALREGATQAEVLEVLELTSVLGVHALSVGVPLLQEVLGESTKKEEPAALTSSDAELSEDHAVLKAEFVKQRGYWNATWDGILALAPEFFAAYTEYSSVPFQPGHSTLDAKTKELVYVAIDCATTHLYGPGLKIHIRNAIEYGASAEEVLEVLQLAGLMGVQSVMSGVDALVDETQGGR